MYEYIFKKGQEYEKERIWEEIRTLGLRITELEKNQKNEIIKKR